jgi:hypothetical protein
LTLSVYPPTIHAAAFLDREKIMGQASLVFESRG